MTASLDLADIAAWVSRPGATPAPGGPSVTEKACGCGVLNGEDCDCAEFAAQARAGAGRPPIFFDFRRAA